MSRARTLRRYGAPTAIAAAVAAAGIGAGIVSASGGEDLPERSAEQLLIDVQTADIDGMSGTVVTSMNLGLPDLALGDSQLSSLLSGDHTTRVWYAAPDKFRGAFVDVLGEIDIIRNGADVWMWDSQETTATHHTLPENMADMPLWPPSAIYGEVTPTTVAEEALAFIEPTTEVYTEGTATVADRAAYELVLEPKDNASLIGEIRLAIDAETHIPLRTQVIAEGASDPAIDVTFSRVDFSVPDEEHFNFDPPSDVTVEEGSDEASEAPWDAEHHDPDAAAEDAGVRVVGEGWGTVLVADADIEQLAGEWSSEMDGQGDFGPEMDSDFDPLSMLSQLESVSGDWGSGMLFKSALLTALITDDGQVFIGAVTPERLYDVAADQ